MPFVICVPPPRDEGIGGKWVVSRVKNLALGVIFRSVSIVFLVSKEGLAVLVSGNYFVLLFYSVVMGGNGGLWGVMGVYRGL